MESEVKTGELIHKTVCYPAGKPDDLGETTVGTTFEINTRWEGYKRRNSANNERTPIAITNRVYVDQALTIGTILWRGELADAPNDPQNLYVVVEFDQTEDLKGLTETLYVLVAKHSSRLNRK